MLPQVESIFDKTRFKTRKVDFIDSDGGHWVWDELFKRMIKL